MPWPPEAKIDGKAESSVNDRDYALWHFPPQRFVGPARGRIVDDSRAVVPQEGIEPPARALRISAPAFSL